MSFIHLGRVVRYCLDIRHSSWSFLDMLRILILKDLKVNKCRTLMIKKKVHILMPNSLHELFQRRSCWVRYMTLGPWDNLDFQRLLLGGSPHVVVFEGDSFKPFFLIDQEAVFKGGSFKLPFSRNQEV